MTELLVNLKNLQLRISKNENVTEEDVRQAINEDIRTYLRTQYHGKQIFFHNEEQTPIHTFIDSKYENFIIEYKKPTVALNDSQKDQLIKYLETTGKYSWGVLTNGVDLEIYTYSPITGRFEKNTQTSGKINELQFKYICDVIANKDQLVLDENTINTHFGIEENRSIIKEIFEILSASTSSKTKLLYDEWQKLFNLSENHDIFDIEKKRNAITFYEELLNTKIDTIEKEYRALFSIQTYYAIVLKLILYKLIVDRTGEKILKPKFYQDFFEDIESNDLYRKYNIINLIDGDFFSWYLGEFSDSQYEYFFNKIVDVTTIETNRINMLFIKFYENIFPFWVRHDMGEYYTPYYLAKSVVDNTTNMVKAPHEKIKLLDPTCGSGIFLLYALEKGIKNIYGIDINPLAVLTSKINYLINNFDISNEIEIPIYLGDSTYFPSSARINDIDCYQYELVTSIHDVNTIKFVFAKDFVNEPHFFETLDCLELQVKQLNLNGAINILKNHNSAHYDQLASYYNDLFSTLINLEKKHLNSIWLKLIGNYLKCGSITDVDCVVGNPPWVRWSNLPDGYKMLISKYCRIDGLFSNDTNSGGVDLNIAALIAFVTIRERLKRDGALGFIMPDSILFNKSFEGFRNMTLPDGKKYYLHKVIRWNDSRLKPFDPVTIEFGEYYFSFNPKTYVDVFEKKNHLHKKAIKKADSFNNHFIVVSEEDYAKISEVLGHNDYQIRSGISLVKGGYYLLQFANRVDDRVSEFYHYEMKNHRLSLSSEKIKLENDLIYPYVKSDDLNDNIITEVSHYCIFPYRYGSKTPLSFSELKQNYPHFFSYFLRPEIQKAINTASAFNSRIQKNTFDVGIFRVGEYTYSDYFLATRDNTKSVFAIVGLLQTPWGEKKMPLFDGHINYYSRDLSGKPLQEAEIKRMFTSFTREGVKLYIKNSSDSRSISGRLYQDINIK